jgi:twitching motility protein PilT
MDLKQLIQQAKKEEASEVHLKIGSAPIIRQRKFLKKMALPAVQPADIEKMIAATLSADEQKRFKDGLAYEGNFWGGDPCNYKMNIFRAQGLPFVMIHLLPSAIPNFEGIQLPPILNSVVEAKSGLFIFSGPPRSGISTSLAALIERINMTRSVHMMVVEEQFEFYFQPKKSRITQRQLKKDLMSIEAGINFAKRMDVDIMVIGDLKRELPFKNIFDYVNGGHMVILTMQNLGVQNTLEKIVNHFSDTEVDYIARVLGHDLIGVCSQALLVDQLEQKMIPLHEILMVNPSIRKMLETGKLSQLENNMKTMDNCFTFEMLIQKMYRDQKLGREIGDGFLSWYRGMKG